MGSRIGKRAREQRHKLQEAAKAVTGTARGILVVEADPDMQWRLARLLTVQGNRVVGTSSGEGALAVLGQWPLDLVLVDEDLPGMSGVDVVRRIQEEHPTVPVVLMTGRLDHKRRLNVAATLIKPFRSEHLTQLLGSLSLPVATVPVAK